MSRWRLERMRSSKAVWGADMHGLAWHNLGEASVQIGSHQDGAARALTDPHGARHLDVIASTDLALHWLQQPPSATRTLEELKLVAATRCAHLFGGNPAEWWIAGDWTARRPFVCSALPRAVVATLQHACQARRTQLRWHSAWSLVASAHARHFPHDGWSAMRSPSRLTLWHCTAGHVDAMATLSIATQATDTEVAHALELQMKLECAAGTPPGKVQWAVDMPRASRDSVAALALAPLLEVAA